MLDFLMNPSLTQSFGTIPWLAPWLIMLLAIIKILFIAVGSLLISAIIILFCALTCKVFFLCRDTYSYHLKAKAKKTTPPLLRYKKPQIAKPDSLPDLAA